ncbi:MAG TPA: hypothetical protein VHN99_06300, partial [Deinococcales bacterium]|nr:hypothetical protein [Deinococcales bacterium]
DHWLVQTVGLLLAVSGGQLLLASRDPVVAASPETRWLAMGTAAALAAIDVYYAGRRVIGKVYLLDALLEGGFVAAWWLSGKNTRRRE